MYKRAQILAVSESKVFSTAYFVVADYPFALLGSLLGELPEEDLTM